MTAQQLLEYVLHNYGTEPDCPFTESDAAVLRHRGSRKWYGLVMRVSKRKLGLPEEATVEVLNVKCDPLLIGSLCRQEGFHPAYHMNKQHWLSIRLDGSASDDMIKLLLDMSFQLTGDKKKPHR